MKPTRDARGTTHQTSGGPGEQQKEQRYVFIDALRGFAALGVVVFHAKEGNQIEALSEAIPAALRWVIAHGDLGVCVFFLISGFVIAHSMRRRNVSWGFVGRFLLRRSVRLDPPYWCSIIVALVIAALSTRFVPGKELSMPEWGNLVAHLVYLQGLLGLHHIQSVYWTLCLELQFYLSFAMLSWCVTRLRARRDASSAFRTVIVPALGLANLWPMGLGPFYVRGLFMEHWHLFMAGVVVWWALHHPEDRWSKACMVVNTGLLGGLGVFKVDIVLMAAATSALLIYVVVRFNALTTWLASRPFQTLGTISYSLYLIHNPVTGVTFRLGYKLTGRGVVFEGLWFFVSIVVCIVAAYVCYRVIEAPTLRLSHRIPLDPTRPLWRPRGSGGPIIPMGGKL